MKPMALTMLLATAGAATWLYRHRPARRGSGFAGTAPADLQAAPPEAVRWPTAATAGESPNAAERFQDGDRLGAPLGGGAPPDDLFESSSQRGEAPVATGLPDLTRGA